MTQIVAQQFELDRIPQSAPRTTEYAIYKTMPQLAEQRLHALPHAAVQGPFVGHVSSRHQQQVIFFGQHLGKLRPAVTQVSQHHAASHRFGQFRPWPAIIEIPRRQPRVHDTTIAVAQGVEFEAKEPAGTALAEVSTLVAQQAHSPVTNGFADRDGFGINQVEAAVTQQASRLKQSADDRTEAMQPLQPLLIRAKRRESGDKVIGNQSVSLFERGDAEETLHQADGDDFRIREGWRRIGRAAPMGQPGMSFEEIINEAVDVSHLVYNGRQMGRPPSVEMSFATSFYTLRNDGDPAFQLNTQV